MPLSAGTELGPYEIVSLVGKGGMIELYGPATPTSIRIVALKVAMELRRGPTVERPAADRSLSGPGSWRRYLLLNV